MKIEWDYIVFASGKRVHISFDIIGIDQEGHVFSGYDEDMEYDELAPRDKIELAEMMIQRWTKYKEAADA